MEMVRTPLGILLPASTAGQEGAVRRALKQQNPRLILTQDFDDQWCRQVWRVFMEQGDRDAVWIADWRAPDGEPLPLSHGLVEMVDRLRVDSRAPQVDPLAANDALHAKHRREAEEALEEIARDTERRMRTAPCFKPSVALRMARDKQRARGWNV